MICYTLVHVSVFVVPLLVSENYEKNVQLRCSLMYLAYGMLQIRARGCALAARSSGLPAVVLRKRSVARELPPSLKMVRSRKLVLCVSQLNVNLRLYLGNI